MPTFQALLTEIRNAASETKPEVMERAMIAILEHLAEEQELQRRLHDVTARGHDHEAISKLPP